MAKAKFPSEEQERFIVRMPDGMRDRLKAEAEKNGRSMNAEVVARLASSFGRHLDLSDEGIVAVLKSASALERGLADLFFFFRDVDLDGFIADQAASGHVMEKTEAVEFILREYLAERGYVLEPPNRRRGLRGNAAFDDLERAAGRDPEERRAAENRRREENRVAIAKNKAELADRGVLRELAPPDAPRKPKKGRAKVSGGTKP